MNNIKPIKLIGSWTEGYALSYHVSSSVYLGVDSLEKNGLTQHGQQWENYFID